MLTSVLHMIATWLILSSLAYGQQATPDPISRIDPADFEAVRLTKVVTALQIDVPITLDGSLDEAVWDRAQPAEGFIQRLPRLGEPATDPTEVRFLYDDTNLYMGVSAFDSNPAGMVINEITEDFNFLQSDVISFILDTLNDDRSAFVFVTNPAGAKYDGQILNGGQNFNVDWDGVWDVAASQTDQGWFAEFAVPFKTLRFSGLENQEWGLNMTRAIRGRNEEAVWSPVPFRFRATRPSLAGTLRGLEGIQQGMNLRVKPYVIGGFTQARPQADPSADFQTDGNLDGGLDAKYSLTQSLTLDLTYRTDFAQVEVDQQQVNLSRFSLFFPEKRDFFLENAATFALGRGGGGFGQGGTNLLPFFSRRIGLGADGEPIPIVGGARVTGQVGAFDVGLLAMRTEEEGTTPANNFAVGRLKRNVLTSSWVGAILTNRDSTLEGDYNRVYGLDANFRFFSERLELDSYLLRSDTPGLSGENLARRVQAGWRDDEFVVASEYNEFQQNFNPEVGFIRRRNISHFAGELAYNPRLTESNLIRNFEFGSTLNYYEGSSSGDIETREQALTTGIRFENNGSVSFSVTETFDRLTGAIRIRGIEILPGDYNYRSYSGQFATDGTEKISGNASLDWGDFWDGTRRSFRSGLALKPNYHLNVSLSWTQDRLELANGSSTTDLVGTRVVYGFTPRAFLNAFFQYNSSTHEVSSNIRFNWTYRPLSDIFIVYNDRRDTLSNQPVEREFIVKFTNLISF